MKPKPTLMLLCLSALMALPVAARAPGEFSPPSRTFLFTYQVTLKDIPAGAQRVRVWIPCAVTDANQTVVLKKVNGPVHLRETRRSAVRQPHPLRRNPAPPTRPRGVHGGVPGDAQGILQGGL